MSLLSRQNIGYSISLVLVQFSGTGLLFWVSWCLTKSGYAAEWGLIASALLFLGFLEVMVLWGYKEQCLLELSKFQEKIQFWHQPIFAAKLVLLPIIGLSALIIAILTETPVVGVVLFACFRFGQKLIEPFVLLNKQFKVRMLLELSAWILIILFNFVVEISPLGVWYLLCLHAGIVCLGLFLSNRVKGVSLNALWVNAKAFQPSHALGVLTLAGLIQAKADSFAGTMVLDNVQFGCYSILASYIVFTQSLSYQAFSVQQPIIYRNAKASSLRVKLLWLFYGLLIHTAGSFFLSLIIEEFYQFNFSALIYLLIAIYGGLTVSTFIPLWESQLKQRGWQVTSVSLIAGAINFLAAVILGERFLIEGLLLSNIVSQSFILIAMSVIAMRR